VQSWVLTSQSVFCPQGAQISSLVNFLQALKGSPVVLRGHRQIATWFCTVHSEPVPQDSAHGSTH
jgi:hypothetical protein